MCQFFSPFCRRFTPVITSLASFFIVVCLPSSCSFAVDPFHQVIVVAMSFVFANLFLTWSIFCVNWELNVNWYVIVSYFFQLSTLVYHVDDKLHYIQCSRSCLFESDINSCTGLQSIWLSGKSARHTTLFFFVSLLKILKKKKPFRVNSRNNFRFI
jgi:hypothetical protein